MKRDPAAAMFARIGSYASDLPAIAALVHRCFGGPVIYQPARYYMRGPGPKWREKQLVQLPGAGGDKLDT